MQPPTEPLFDRLTAFLSPLVPLETRVAWTSHGGIVATHSQVHDDSCNIDLWLVHSTRRYLDPLVPRLQALGIELHDYAWIHACVANHRLVSRSPFSLASLDLDSSPLALTDTAPDAPTYSSILSHGTPCSASPSSSHHVTPTPTALHSRTTTTSAAHDHDTPMTTAARSTKFHGPLSFSPSPVSSRTSSPEALSLSDAEVEGLLLERAGHSSFLGKLRASQAAESTDDDKGDLKMLPSPFTRPHDRLSSSESQFADLEDLADAHLTPSFSTLSRRSRSASTSDDKSTAHAEADDAPSSLAAFFAKPLAGGQGGGRPVYDADALVALLWRQSSTSREQVERIVHSEGGWTVRRRARGGTRDEW
ncbi:hypothetical protein JCM8208_007039 [Rhodotorula glutinis]